jgi:hypothetical protein
MVIVVPTHKAFDTLLSLSIFYDRDAWSQNIFLEKKKKRKKKKDFMVEMKWKGTGRNTRQS